MLGVSSAFQPQQYNSGEAMKITPPFFTITLASAILGVHAKPPATPVLVVQGTIKSVAKTPRPETVTYKNSVTEIHLVNIKVLSGKLSEKGLLVYMQAMKNKKWLPPATYKNGQTVKLSLQPWEKVERTFGGMQRHTLSVDEVGELEEYWGEATKS